MLCLSCRYSHNVYFTSVLTHWSISGIINEPRAAAIGQKNLGALYVEADTIASRR